MQTGVYVDPNRGKITIGDWSARWLDGQAHLKPSTHERYAGILREHVLPQWSAVCLTGKRKMDRFPRCFVESCRC